MNISPNNQNITFTGDDFAKKLKEAKKDFKKAVKEGADKDTFQKIHDRFKSIEDGSKVKNLKIPAIFPTIVKWFGKVKVDKTGNKALDTASALTKVVLWGNVGKEVVGTAIYTVQALTNEDLDPDKRKFIGMYDLAVGVVSTACSFVFGVGLEKKIKDGYKNLLKPLTKSENLVVKSRAAAAIVGLAAFSSFALQTIVGKRIVAPAIATPIAGNLKGKLEARELKKKQAQQPAETKTEPKSDLAQQGIANFKQKISLKG